MTTPDMSTLAKALANDLDGTFAEYVRSTADGIYSGSLRMLGDRGDAEDVMQETYTRAYAALSGYSRKRIVSLKVRGWTWTIAANLCRNRLRSRARKPTRHLHNLDIPAAEPDAAEDALSEIGATLAAALLELPFPQRAAVVMRHILDLNNEEVAVALDRPVGTVKADVHRGLKRLRQNYSKEVT